MAALLPLSSTAQAKQPPPPAQAATCLSLVPAAGPAPAQRAWPEIAVAFAKAFVTDVGWSTWRWLVGGWLFLISPTVIFRPKGKHKGRDKGRGKGQKHKTPAIHEIDPKP